MGIFDRILSREEFRQRPPVLVDIGASGRVHPKWAPIARHAVCVAFDADEREMKEVRTESGANRALHVYNRVVTAGPDEGEVEFYLTRSPFCSSTLRPARDKLAGWRFADLFELDRVVRLPAITLRSALAGLKIDYVDWFKCDSQGTDLRLLASLGDPLIGRLLAAELEPGIIEAYDGEDDLASVLGFMKARPFWVSGLDVKGTQRIGRGALDRRFGPLQRRFLGAFLKPSPAWAEVTFLNSFARADDADDDAGDGWGARDYMLGWVFACVEGQYGFAIELAAAGGRRFGDRVFDELQDAAASKAKARGYARFPGRAVRAAYRKLNAWAGIA